MQIKKRDLMTLSLGFRKYRNKIAPEYPKPFDQWLCLNDLYDVLRLLFFLFSKKPAGKFGGTVIRVFIEKPGVIHRFIGKKKTHRQ